MHVNPNPYYYQFFPPGHHPAPPTFTHLSDSITVGGIPVSRQEPSNQAAGSNNYQHDTTTTRTSTSPSPPPLNTSTSSKENRNPNLCTDCTGDSVPNLDPGGDPFVRPDTFIFDDNHDICRAVKWFHDFRDLVSLQKYKEKPKYQNMITVYLDHMGLVNFIVVLLTSTHSLIQDKSHGSIMSLLLYASSNPQLCYLFECNENQFSHIKEEQNLKITFSQFPDKMTEILRLIPSQYEIKITNLIETQTTKDSNENPKVASTSAVLSIYESNEFRIYNHLSLKIQRLQCCGVKRILNHELLLYQNFATCLSYRLTTEMQRSSSLQNELQKLTDEKRAMTAQHVADFQAMQEEHMTEIEGVKTKYKDLVGDLEAEKLALRNQLQTAEHDAESLRLEIHRLGLVEAEHRGCASVLQERKDLLTKVAVLSAKLDDKDETIDALKTQLKDYEAMKTKYSTLEAEVSDAKMMRLKMEEKTEQLNAYKERSRTLQAKLKEAEETVNELEAKFEEARKEVEELKSEFTDRNQAYNVNAQMLEAKDLRIQQLEIEYEKMCQANFELNRRLTDSIVRNAKRQQPEHFRSDTSSIDRILFPEKGDVEQTAPNMPAIPSLHAHTVSNYTTSAKPYRSNSHSYVQPTPTSYGSASVPGPPASQPLPTSHPYTNSSSGGVSGPNVSTPPEGHKYPAMPHSATLPGAHTAGPPTSAGTNQPMAPPGSATIGQKKAKNAFNIRRTVGSQRGSL